MIPYDIPQAFVLCCLFILGATIGSFLNVCIYRLPQQDRTLDAWRGLTHPPSACPFCRTRIRWHDNIPIFGWLLLWGRCRDCRHNIPIRYALIEFLNGALFVLLYWQIVPAGYTARLSDSCLWTTIGPLSAITLDRGTLITLVNLQYLYYLVLVEALLVATFIDFDLQIIPDSVTIPGAVVGLGGAILCHRLWLTPIWLSGFHVPGWIAASPWLHAFTASLAGAAMGAGLVWGVQVIGKGVLRRDAMGDGDIILMAMIGSYVGWQAVVLVFFLAPMLALAVIAAQWMFRRVYVIPYGPYLSLATLIVVLCWQPLWGRLSHVFGLGPWLGLYVVLMAVMLYLSLLTVQGVKWLLGMPLYPADDQSAEWTSADQLTFFASYDRHSGQGAMQRPEWPGVSAGTGQRQRHAWRNESR